MSDGFQVPSNAVRRGRRGGSRRTTGAGLVCSHGTSSSGGSGPKWSVMLPSASGEVVSQ